LLGLHLNSHSNKCSSAGEVRSESNTFFHNPTLVKAYERQIYFSARVTYDRAVSTFFSEAPRADKW
jgi:hypothetical protein